MRNILKAIVFTGVMGVAATTWGTQEIKIGDNVTLTVSPEIPELVKLNDSNIPTAYYGNFCEICLSEATVTVTLLDVLSNFQDGKLHALEFKGLYAAPLLRVGGENSYTFSSNTLLQSFLCTESGSVIAVDTPITITEYLSSLGLADQTKVDFSAVYRIKITAKNTDETEVSKCFDFLVGGKCDLSTQKAPLEVIPEETIPDILTKNSAGQIVFAPPRPIGTVRLPKGHTCKEIMTKAIYKRIEGISDAISVHAFCRLNNTGNYDVVVSKEGGITDEDVVELTVGVDGKAGTDVSTLGVSGAFDWSTVIRGPIYITP